MDCRPLPSKSVSARSAMVHRSETEHPRHPGFYLSATILLLATVFSGTLFPACFVEGQGLTPFKIVSEYIICFVLIASLVLLLRRRDKFDPHILRLIVWSILFTIVSELAFTFLRLASTAYQI